jgi:hypothetical protein
MRKRREPNNGIRSTIPQTVTLEGMIIIRIVFSMHEEHPIPPKRSRRFVLQKNVLFEGSQLYLVCLKSKVRRGVMGAIRICGIRRGVMGAIQVVRKGKETRGLGSDLVPIVEGLVKDYHSSRAVNEEAGRLTGEPLCCSLLAIGA